MYRISNLRNNLLWILLDEKCEDWLIYNREIYYGLCTGYQNDIYEIAKR